MRKSIIAGSILLCALFSLSCGNSKDDIEDSLNVINDEILNLVNEVRISGIVCGETYYPPVQKLSRSLKLEQLALNHSQDMFDNNFCEHISSDGTSFTDRLINISYNFIYAGENIANGYSSEQAVVNAWLSSQAHCANIMNSNFTEMGVGRVGNYWTQDFGTPKQ
nr:CAP domain-containing protein [uncultured Marinifilum sp.]